MPRPTLLVVCAMSLAACSGSPTPSRTVTPDEIVARGDCPAVSGAGTPHANNVTADETWTAAGSPHLVSSLRIEATVTLEPCAVVLLAKEAVLQIGNGENGKPGKLIANGSADATTLKPVLFKPQTDGQRWSAISVYPTGSLDFAYTAVLGGGNSVASSTNAAIFASGTQKRPLQQNLKLRSVVVRDSGSQGISLRSYAAFTSDSEKLFISGSGAEPEADARFLTGFPLDIQPPGLGTIPAGSELKGNRRDSIYVRSVTRLDVNETFPARGLPYLFNGDFLMYDLGKSTLTLRIEAGVTMRFEQEGLGSMGLVLGNLAAEAPVQLLAQGTASAPILLSSAQPQPQPGDWLGIELANSPASGNSMTYVTVEYAGGFSGTSGYGCGPGANVGGLLIIDWKPADAFVQNCTFRNTIGAGIVSGWTSDDAGPDLKPTNTFSAISDVPTQGHCEVTQWAPKTGSCGTRPTCR